MKIKKGDILVFFIILIAFLSYLGIKQINKQTDDKDIVIEIDGKEYRRIPMDEIKEESLIHIDLSSDRFIDILIKEDGVYVNDVVCPDRICVKTGLINKVGQTIVCLPNKVLITIEGRKELELDGISY